MEVDPLLVLALTSSTPRASVALIDGDLALAELSSDDPRGHAEHLFSLIDAALEVAGRSRAEVDLVACDVGPGSFTGARIAVASAKGIAMGLGVPLAGVSSLEAMAAHARSLTGGQCALVAAAIDAKKGELYVAVYDAERAVLPPTHLACADVAPRVAQVLAGRSFVSIADTSAFIDFAPGAEHRLVRAPSATWIGRIAAALGGVDPASVVPLYVRAPDAVPTAGSSAGAPFDMLPPR